MRMSRRSFIKNSSIATAGVMISGVAPIFTSPKARAETPNIRIHTQGRSLVFIMLDGGNDSFNMLVPTSQAAYEEYHASRSNLALSPEQLLPLNNFTDSQGRTFGVHQSMPEVQQLFHDKKLAFVANIGALVEPVTKETFKNGSAQLPLGLMSHADQFKHWQSARPDLRINQGWLGYFADVLQANRPNSQIPMNISLAGSNIAQNGADSRYYSITEKGSVGLVVNEEKTPLNDALLSSFEGLLNIDYSNDPFKSTYLSITRESQAQHEIFRNAVDKVAVPVAFSGTPLSQQLKMVAQTIKASAELNLPQQTYFVRYIGWDHHDELLNNHAKMLRILSQALGEFQQAIEALGVADNVATFTGSDFGRTLTSNGNGTDHGWGGNCILLAKALGDNGGQVFGEYPPLSLGDANPLDVGDGVLIPTQPLEYLYSVLALWFGVYPDDLPLLFSNMRKFT